MITIQVARLWHKKGKYEYFGLKQLTEAFPNISFDFHIVLDQFDYTDEWSAEIDSLGLSITYYSKEDMQRYIGVYSSQANYNLSKFIHFYHIAIGHYLRRVKLCDYMLTYEYDIIFNNEDLSEVEECLVNKIPFGISEPLNSNCDKALYAPLCKLFNAELANHLTHNNPSFLGINAGFQGINLAMFDEFLSTSGFSAMMSLFDFTGVYREDGTEKWGTERTIFDTQEQSFYGLLNQMYSPTYRLLDPTKYYFHPCWDDFEGYVEKAMGSKIVHFTGHVKSKKMFEIIHNTLK